MSSLKKMIEWMLIGNFLTDKTDPQFAYGINLRTSEFYSTYLWSVGHKRRHIIHRDVHLPLEDIKNNMVIYTPEESR